MNRERKSTDRIEQFRGLFSLLAASLKHAKWITIGALILYPIAYLEPVVVALGLRWTIDALVATDTRGALVGIITIVSGVSLFYIFDQMAWRLCLRLEEIVGHALDRRTAELVSSTPGIEHFERPDFLDRVEILREQGWMLGRYLYSLPMTWGDIIKSVATIAILGSVHPLLYLLPLFGIPAIFTESRADTIYRDAEEKTAEDLRRSRSIFELTVRPDAAKEIRIYRLKDWIFTSHREVWKRIHAILTKARARSTFLMSFGWILFSSAFVFALVFVTRLALRGDASLGDLMLTLTLGVRVGGEVSSMAGEINYLKRIARLGSHLTWIERYAEKAAARIRGSKLFTGLDVGVRFENVSFSYTGANLPALSEITLDIKAGQTLALVGQNGAGKTTLVKLLCRMYEPTTGNIYADDVPLADFDLDSWRSGITAAFQDFARFEVAAREAIGIGDLARIEQPSAIVSALQRAAALETVRSFPNDLDTTLGGSWPDGHEPSIGQWQKIAIARFAMRDKPTIYILDEPTASLDPQTEHEVFVRHRDIVKTGAPDSITVLVSHRFSTVSMADRIVVLDRGSIVEYGTHNELLEAGGYYARFYQIQQRAFHEEQGISEQ